MLSVRDRIGADKMVRLFTEGAGMIEARAMGVREERSKMRYALQPFTFIRVSLVRGKREWRVAGAEALKNPYLSANDRACRGAIVRTARSLERLIHGEEENATLFHLVTDSVTELASKGTEVAERTALFRLLTQLGYVAPNPALTLVVQARTLSDALEHLEPSMHDLMAEHIAEALTVSHL